MSLTTANISCLNLNKIPNLFTNSYGPLTNIALREYPLQVAEALNTILSGIDLELGLFTSWWGYIEY